MAQWELPGDIIIKAGSQIFFENAGGPSWQAFSESNVSAMQFNYTQHTTTVGPTLSLRRGRGTFAAPLACANSDILGAINVRGHDGTQMFDASDLSFTAGAAWSATEHTSRLAIRLTLTSGTKAEYYRFSPDGIRLGNGATQMSVAYITTGGLQWGTVNTQKQSWWAAVPVVQDLGWGTPTGTLTRTAFDTTTVTLPQLAERVAALISVFKTYGLLGA